MVLVQSRAGAFSLGVHQRGAAEVTRGCDHKEGARWVLGELRARPRVLGGTSPPLPSHRPNFSAKPKPTPKKRRAVRFSLLAFWLRRTEGVKLLPVLPGV